MKFFSWAIEYLIATQASDAVIQVHHTEILAGLPLGALRDKLRELLPKDLQELCGCKGDAVCVQTSSRTSFVFCKILNAQYAFCIQACCEILRYLAVFYCIHIYIYII